MYTKLLELKAPTFFPCTEKLFNSYIFPLSYIFNIFKLHRWGKYYLHKHFCPPPPPYHCTKYLTLLFPPTTPSPVINDRSFPKVTVFLFQSNTPSPAIAGRSRVFTCLVTSQCLKTHVSKVWFLVCFDGSLTSSLTKN